MLCKMIDRFPYYKEIRQTCYHGQAGSTTDATGLGFPTNAIAPSAAFLGGSKKFKIIRKWNYFSSLETKFASIWRPKTINQRMVITIIQISPNIAFHHLADNNRFQLSIWGSQWVGCDMHLFQPKLQMSQKRHGSMHATFRAVHPLQKWEIWCLELFGGVLIVSNCWIIGPPCPPPVILPFWGQSIFSQQRHHWKLTIARIHPVAMDASFIVSWLNKLSTFMHYTCFIRFQYATHLAKWPHWCHMANLVENF